MKSVFTDDLSRCIMTGTSPVHIHHIFHGKSRMTSEEDGYIIPLVPWLHNMSKYGIHFDHEFDLYWKRKAQVHYERNHTREEFIKRYGRSYL